MNTSSKGTRPSQADIALQIEALVQAVERQSGPASRIGPHEAGHKLIGTTKYSRYFTHIRQMLDLVMDDAEYSFSEHLQVFKDACHDIGLERRSNGPICLNDQGSSYLDHFSSMAALIKRILLLTSQEGYRRKHRDRRELAKQQGVRVAEYVQEVSERYSRTTAVRMDYHYKTETQGRLRIEHVFEELDLLISEHRRNPIFEHLIGHIYAVEQGDRADGSGYHIHALYLFNGNQVSRDVYKAQQLNKLWHDITQGQGRSYSSNFDKESFGEDCGIGLLGRADIRARQGLQKVAKYLVKHGQYLRLKPVRAKALRVGLF